MKKNGLMVAALVLALAGSSFAAEAENKLPRSQGGLAHENLHFMGMKVKRITATASPALLVSSAVFLDGLCVFGGTLGKYSMAFDTDGGNQITNCFGSGAIPCATYAVSPKVYSFGTPTQESSAGYLGSCWWPPAPIKLLTGLYGDQDDAGHSTVYYVHCSDGDNPCAP